MKHLLTFKQAERSIDPRIQVVINLIEKDVGGQLALEDLARLVGLSSSRLRHKFKSEIGVTPSTYAQKTRMKIAVELLRSGRLSVKEVRATIGLESASHFAHKCKRVYGLTPSRMRYNESGSIAITLVENEIATYSKQ